MPKKLTTDEFINRAKQIHGDKYDYSLVDYINRRTKIKIVCRIHGIFEQRPDIHLQSNECCPLCHNHGKNNIDNFIKKSNIIHNNKYTYFDEYVDSHTKIKIKCPIHGIFEQRPNDHLSGYGCIKCSGRYSKKDECIKTFNQIHNNKFDYSLMNYKNNKTKIKIICPIHGIFEQRPDNHLQGNGCPNCNNSMGEMLIKKILDDKNIKYESEKKFKNCKNIFELPFDFYLPIYNICIEFDGEQHFKPIKYFGGKKEFKKLQKRDQIKNEYCKNNNIHLVRIKYDESINEKLKYLFD